MAWFRKEGREEEYEGENDHITLILNMVSGTTLEPIMKQALDEFGAFSAAAGLYWFLMEFGGDHSFSANDILIELAYKPGAMEISPSAYARIPDYDNERRNDWEVFNMLCKGLPKLSGSDAQNMQPSGYSGMDVDEVNTVEKDEEENVLLDLFNRGEFSEPELARRMKQLTSSLGGPA